MTSTICGRALKCNVRSCLKIRVLCLSFITTIKYVLSRVSISDEAKCMRDLLEAASLVGVNHKFECLQEIFSIIQSLKHILQAAVVRLVTLEKQLAQIRDMALAS